MKVASSVSHPSLTLASVITVVVPRRQRGAASVPLSVVRVLRTAAETRAPAAGPRSFPPRLLSVCLCYAAAFFFFFSRSCQVQFEQKIAQNMPEKPAKTTKTKKKRILHKLLFILLYILAEER